jgi:hypothetical protein
MVKYKAGAMVKLAPRGHVVAKMITNAEYQVKAVESGPSSAAAEGEEEKAVEKSKHLFADGTVPSFFRYISVYVCTIRIYI